MSRPTPSPSSTGTVSLRRFERRPTEVLLLGQLVGARVRIATTAAAATVVDVGFEQTRTRDWLVTRLAVRERTGPLSRRAPVQVVGWNDVRGTDVLELLGPVRPHHPTAARVLRERQGGGRRVRAPRSAGRSSVREVAEAMGDDRLADIIEELPEDDQKDLLTHLDEARAADILEAMDPDDAADLLGELPTDPGPTARADGAGGVRTGPTAAAVLLRHRRRPDDPGPGGAHPGRHHRRGVGPDPCARADPGPGVHGVRLPPATGHARPAAISAACTPSGCCASRRSSWSPGVIDTEMARLSAGAGLLEVTRFFATYNLVCAPVVDDEDHLLGAVDRRRRARPPAARQLARHGAGRDARLPAARRQPIDSGEVPTVAGGRRG